MSQVIVRGQLQSEIVGIRQTFDKLGNPCETFYQFKLVGREDTTLPTWKSHAELQALNPYVVLGIPTSSTTEGGQSVDNSDHTTESDQLVDPNATDELPIVIVPEETKQEFTAHLSLASRLFLEILINHAVDLPIDTLDLVAEARDTLRDAAQELTRLQREAKNSAYEVTIIKAQLAAVTAERDAAIQQVADYQAVAQALQKPEVAS